MDWKSAGLAGLTAALCGGPAHSQEPPIAELVCGGTFGFTSIIDGKWGQIDSTGVYVSVRPTYVRIVGGIAPLNDVFMMVSGANEATVSFRGEKGQTGSLNRFNGRLLVTELSDNKLVFNFDATCVKPKPLF